MPRVANDQVTVCNYALRHLAVGKVIQSIDEATQEAKACKAFFEQTRDEVLGDFAWPFATAIGSLALVSGTSTVPAATEWRYSYRLPSDCIRVRAILNGTSARINSAQSRIPYRVGRDSVGGLLFTDLETRAATASSTALPEVEYTACMDDPAAWPADFAQAVALKLAAYIAPQLTGGDPNKLGARAFGLYQQTVSRAAANAFNAEGADLLPDSEFIRSRDE